MPGIAVRRRTAKGIGVSDSFHSWTARRRKYCSRYVNWWRRTTNVGKTSPLCILDTDIAKAYDNVTYGLVEKGLTNKEVPKPIIAAWLREWTQMKSTMRLNQETKSLPLSRGRSLLQGDPMAPAIFVACMDILLERFWEICQERGLGYHDQGFMVAGAGLR